MQFNNKETAHILAALRYCQGRDLTHLPHWEDSDPLTDAEVDALCEKLNCGSGSVERLVEVTIEGGAVQNVEVPPGIRVVIKDYDVEGCDFDGFDIRQDDEGHHYQYMEFVHEEPEESNGG